MSEKLKQLQSAGELQAVRTFFDNVAKAAGTGRLSTEALKDLLAGGQRVPKIVDLALGAFPEASHAALLDAVRWGEDEFRKLHGQAPSAMLATSALQRAVVDRIKSDGSGGMLSVMDSAANTHHDQLSLHPNPAIVGIMQMYAFEAHPLIAQLPTDNGSNESRLIIAEPVARSHHGDYNVGDSLAGVKAGGAFFEGERFIDWGVTGGATASLSATVRTRNGDAGSPAPALLRGRSKVFVNGLPVAAEVTNNQNGTGANAIAGSVTLGSTTYTITGSVNNSTAAVAVNFAPDLPAGHAVSAAVYLDFEANPDMTPEVGFVASTYVLYAHPSRGLTHLTPDAQTQFAQEPGLDAQAQMQLAMRQQFAAERHYAGTRKLLDIARQDPVSWDYNYVSQIAEKDYAQIFLNLGPVLAHASQRMVERTNDHGIDTLFVTGKLAAKFKGLPTSMWEPSGINVRPGIYRMGRFLGEYDVYYVPEGKTSLTEGSTSTQMLASGRGSDVTRSPLVSGDAVAARLMPISTGKDMATRTGFYARSFTEVNPHLQSANAATRVDVTNFQ